MTTPQLFKAVAGPIVPDPGHSRVLIEAEITGPDKGLELTVEAFADGRGGSRQTPASPAVRSDDLTVVEWKERPWAEPTAPPHGLRFRIHHRNVVAPYCTRATPRGVPDPFGLGYSLPRPLFNLVRELFAHITTLACLWMLGYPTATAEPPALQLSWGAPAPVARGGWGRMIQLVDGDWLAVSTRFARPQSTLQLLLSKDAARTWTAVGEVSEPGRLLDNGDLIRLRDGTLRLTGRSLVAGESYRLPVYRSSDAGKTWSLLSTIDANEGAPGSLSGRGLWEPHFYQLADGRLAAAYANEKHAAEQPAYSQVCSVKVSADGGESWGREITLASEPEGGKLRPGMPVVQRMADGRFIAVFEIVGVGDADVFYKISPDGVEWPAGLGKPIPGHHAGPWVTALADGRLLLTSCSNTLSYSDDNGLTWHPAEPPAWNVRTGKNFTWPAIYQTGANEVAAMVSWHGVQVRFGTLGNYKSPTPPTP